MSPASSPSGGTVPWSGGFVARELGVDIHSDPSGAVAVEDLVGLALRRNPKRAHLLISQVLAKHVPVEPALAMAAGELLGAFVARELAETPAPGSRLPGSPLAGAAAQLTAALRATGPSRDAAVSSLAAHVAALRTPVPDAVVLGFAETATGLGRLVANALGAYYIHSTRHATPGVPLAAGFQEGHSHATSHRMVPADPRWLDGPGPVVLVDDELSTGSTVINTIRELHALVPRGRYVVAALIDLRSPEDRSRFDRLAGELGCRISVAALGTGRIGLPGDVLARAQRLLETLEPAPEAGAPAGRLSLLELTAAEIAPVRSDRYGNTAPPAAAGISRIAADVAGLLERNGCQGPVTVVGCEENIFLPLAVAAELAALRPAAGVRFSTTTRSPIFPLDRGDYAIAGALTFASHDDADDGPGVRYAYNLTGAGRRPGTIVAFPEPGADRRALLHGNPAAGLAGLAAALRTAAADAVVVLLPADTPAPTTAFATAPEDAAP
ncbi:phosphoribosyltransferase domain-containing protein [Arthrobacter sp. SDTb3-6]|uniref:phosphoribosyltransferase domain-containing protein n=1 Tax=Arthrobacter sp. SDTb3-6 TaxID=2713571 RepID=UPI001C400D9D|nr:phosphoribosyltransferase domain-containing protein [Arthrobacter sp. SDTb3-6]